ncbi:MAG: hypothetical protein KAF64_22310 [Hydrogenophaga sp.]|uniref:hypothetical protein n=1 Tax=Hydrogenophaga sp. TaxID=1904254 RepID=UPI0025C5E23E|nr:hypothetical protein [Hydrogenophaga sp.]MBU7576109.1 hypothetical protein [Hydrogenophaga sp.]
MKVAAVIEMLLSNRLLRATICGLLMHHSAMSQEPCDRNGVALGFFNGVQTTYLQANDARREIRKVFGEVTPSSEPITYELFYNDSEGFADFVETFDQRLHEHGGLLAGRFELFFSATRGEGAWWRAITSAIPSLVGFLDSLFDLSRAALMTELTANLGNPNMAEVAGRHRAQIDPISCLSCIQQGTPPRQCSLEYA